MDILEVKRNLNIFQNKLDEMRGHLDLEIKIDKISDLERLTLADNFWDDRRKSESIIKEINGLKSKVYDFKKLEEEHSELMVLLEFAETGEHEFEKELAEKYPIFEKDIENYETALLLDGEYDNSNAIVIIHSGAGGTESCDWAEMLFRMYSKWCSTNKYSIEMIDKLDGDGAGIKSCTFMVKGPNAFGYLKAEKGVHRLVRISPFDSNKRRHTSFASVDAIPEIDDSIEVNIRPEDLKIDTYRSSGAGGQHVNVTDSAVRITHLPTKIVVTCQNERSQMQNRESAMKVLRSRLMELERKKKEEEIRQLKGESAEIGWGSQIRSYVFQPYQMVKDHRTGFESGNVQAVMDGDIDGFIGSFLKFMKSGGVPVANTGMDDI